MMNLMQIALKPKVELTHTQKKNQSHSHVLFKHMVKLLIVLLIYHMITWGSATILLNRNAHKAFGNAYS